MSRSDALSLLSTCRWAALSLLLWSLAGIPAYSQDADALKSRHRSLSASLANNSFNRPLHIESTEHARTLQGDVYAVVDRPYVVVANALSNSDNWCHILILHFNVKRCRATARDTGAVLFVNVGRKFAQPIDDTHLLTFDYRLVTTQPGYLHVALDAEDGPMGTSDYRIAFELVELSDDLSFLRLSYSYSVGAIARLATRMYLSTLGRDKVGFEVIGAAPDGKPIYAGKMRGMIERNSMRYFLAIESFLDTASAPEPERLESRLNAWFVATERYPLQLHELERSDYLLMKREEVANGLVSNRIMNQVSTLQ